MVLPSYKTSSKKQQSFPLMHSNLTFYIFCLFLHFFALFSSTSSLANKMNNYRDEYSPCCYFHPKEVIVGVCALCLRERLLHLASKQGQLPLSKDSNTSFRLQRRRPRISLPKVFALGSFLHRLESRRQRPDDDDSDQGSIASPEDSFISIKFEGNGQASWEGKKQSTDDSSEAIKRGKSVVEHVKLKGTLRWRKRIGQLLQLERWKRSSKARASHVGPQVGKVEGRRGWIRSLTRRRTTD